MSTIAYIYTDPNCDANLQYLEVKRTLRNPQFNSPRPFSIIQINGEFRVTMNWIIRLLLNGLAVVLTAYLLPGVSVADYGTALLVALILAVLNVFVKPILVLFTIPITILT